MNNDDLIKNKIFRVPGLGRRELSRILNMDVRTVSASVSRLEQAGFIVGRTESIPGYARRPTARYRIAEGAFHFGGIFLSEHGLSGSSIEFPNRKCAEIEINSFNLRAEIPISATRKIIAVVTMLEKQAGAKLNALALVFPEDYYQNAISRLIRQLLAERLLIPVYCESQLTTHAYDFLRENPTLRRVLLLHFGYQLELALLEDCESSVRHTELTRQFRHLPTGVRNERCVCGADDCLWNQVSLAEIVYEFSALEGQVFSEHSIVEQISMLNVAGRAILDRKEAIILSSLDRIIREWQPDLLAVIALSDDHHLRAMPKLVSGDWGIDIQKTECRFLDFKHDNDRKSALLGANAASFLALERFK